MVNNEPSLIHYYTVRVLVGILGITLPLVLAVGTPLLTDEPCRPVLGCLQDSISAYHGTQARDVFVGMVFAIGVFLFSYKGYEDAPRHPRLLRVSDALLGQIASACAIGVALLPYDGRFPVDKLHLACAAGVFVSLAIFSLCRFTLSKGGMTKQKRWRNWIYRFCGVTIFVCILLIIVYFIYFEGTGMDKVKPVFWLEAVALWAFGISWFVKGKGICWLNDPGEQCGLR